jgi:hypothetical protein
MKECSKCIHERSKFLTFISYSLRIKFFLLHVQIKCHFLRVQLLQNVMILINISFRMLNSNLIIIFLKKILSNLTPKGPRVFFSKNAPNLPFLAQEEKMKFFSLFAFSTIGSCTRLLGEHVKKVSRHLTTRIVRL